jgi:hypothetical protein
LGFSLILVCLSGTGYRTVVLVSTGCFVVEAAFEIGQLTRVSAWLEFHLPQWFDRVWLLDHTGAYFRVGVFDPLDIIAAAAAAILTIYVVAAFNPERRHRDDQPKQKSIPEHHPWHAVRAVIHHRHCKHPGK